MKSEPSISELVQRSARIYRECVTEVRFRITHAESMLKRLKERNSSENRVLVAELVALQFRKTIELIALASIAANEDLYARLRSEFHRDWKPRLIFRDVERVNPKFYPKPIAGLTPPEKEGDPSVVEEYDDGFLDKKAALALYDRCSTVLHAQSPFKHSSQVNSVIGHFETQIPLFKRLLENFWVYLVPADKAFCVWSYYGQKKNVDIALFRFG